MATDSNRQKRPNSARKRRPNQGGVPTMLVIVLLIIALLMGGLAGFAVARTSDPSRIALQEANAKIMELENTLTLIGFSTDEDDPENWIYDNTPAGDGLSDLSGNFGDENTDLWNDDSLLSGTLSETGDPVVVAEFDGGQLMSNEVIPVYNDALTTQIFAGENIEEISDSLLQETLSGLVTNKIIAAKASELGLDALSDEDLAEIEKQAASDYSAQLTYFSAFVAEDGMSDAEIQAAAAQYMESENGISLDSITEELKELWWAKKYFDHVVKDVTVTDEEVQQYYSDLLAEQKSSFTEYPEGYEFAHINGDVILYNPEGYRAVRDVLIPFDSLETSSKAGGLIDQLEQMNPETDADAMQQVDAQLDELFAPLEPTAEEVVQKLKDGASFTSMMDEYGCDALLAEEPLRSTGYYITDSSYINSREYVEGSMILESAGSVSTPLRSSAGLHLVQYIGDVTPGEVPFSAVKDALREDALALKQAEYYDAQCAEMLAQANVKYYPERLQ